MRKSTVESSQRMQRTSSKLPTMGRRTAMLQVEKELSAAVLHRRHHCRPSDLRRTLETASGEAEIAELGDPVLARYADKINKLGRRMVTDVIEIGRLLDRAKKRAGHGHWLPLLRAVGLSHDTASNMMRVSEFLRSAKFRKFRNLKAPPLTVLYTLAREGVPDGVREDVLARVATGERVSARMITQDKRASPAPDPVRVNQLAKPDDAPSDETPLMTAVSTEQEGRHYSLEETAKLAKTIPGVPQAARPGRAEPAHDEVGAANTDALAMMWFRKLSPEQQDEFFKIVEVTQITSLH